jgi:hypothetical protein
MTNDTRKNNACSPMSWALCQPSLLLYTSLRKYTTHDQLGRSALFWYMGSHSQLYTYTMIVKFIVRNTLYFVFGKNNKKPNLVMWTVYFFFQNLSNCLLCQAYITRYFVLKICTVIAYTVGYIQVFFLIFLKLSNLNFFGVYKTGLQGTRELIAYSDGERTTQAMVI